MLAGSQFCSQQSCMLHHKHQQNCMSQHERHHHSHTSLQNCTVTLFAQTLVPAMLTCQLTSSTAHKDSKPRLSLFQPWCPSCNVAGAPDWGEEDVQHLTEDDMPPDIGLASFLDLFKAMLPARHANMSVDETCYQGGCTPAVVDLHWTDKVHLSVYICAWG